MSTDTDAKQVEACAGGKAEQTATHLANLGDLLRLKVPHADAVVRTRENACCAVLHRVT